jgi:GT2 family glycosyltransferase
VAFRAALDTGADFVAYLNDDLLQFSRGWLAQLVEALQQDERYAVAAPSGPCRSVPQSKGRPGSAYGVFEQKHPLAWFCAVVRRQALLEVGLFDTGYTHYCDESDWEMRARQQGWTSVWVRHVYVGHRDDGDRFDGWWQADMARFKQRWPNA